MLVIVEYRVVGWGRTVSGSVLLHCYVCLCGDYLCVYLCIMIIGVNNYCCLVMCKGCNLARYLV